MNCLSVAFTFNVCRYTEGAAALEANAEGNQLAANAKLAVELAAELAAEQETIAKPSWQVGLGESCGAASSTV